MLGSGSAESMLECVPQSSGKSPSSSPMISQSPEQLACVNSITRKEEAGKPDLLAGNRNHRLNYALTEFLAN